MAARIGADDGDLFASPQPKLLREITGIRPVAKGTHVLLADHGVRSTQRLAAGDVGGTMWVALWPGELKEQAIYLYGNRLARPMIAAARAHGWTAAPSPPLAFRNSQTTLRLYMAPTVYRDLLTSSMDVYLSTVSNRHNSVVKQLTIIATIFLPVSWLTGFFGQNEIVGLAALLIYFKRRGWF